MPRGSAAPRRGRRDTVALTTLAGVADGYFELLSLRERLQIAAANREAARELLEVVQARFDAGQSDPVELATQRGVLSAAQLVIPDLQQRAAAALAALAVLVGQPPEDFKVGGHRPGRAERAAGGAGAAGGADHAPSGRLPRRGEPAGRRCGPGRGAGGAAAVPDADRGRAGCRTRR